MGLTGIRIKCSGRLKGVEMAKSEVFSQGSVPLHRFEYLVDYGFSSVVTTFGLIGISVWCFKKGAIHSC
jgi:small subunit ribosomal protein S3